MYKGDLEGFPKEVVDWMLKQQVLQGNKEDITAFESYRALCRYEGGFDWENTKEGIEFCNQVIANKRFDIFFKRYSQSISENEKPTYPKIMRVDHNPITKENKGLKRVVFAEKAGVYIAWVKAETFAEAENETRAQAWKYAKDIEPENPIKLELIKKADELLTLANKLKETAKTL